MLNKTEQTLAIYSKRSEQGKSLQRVYRQLFKPELYETAYSGIYANLGATTKGTGDETLDGMSAKRIDNIIEAIKTEQFKWRPARRTYIPKSNGRSRPLGIPLGDDKLLQAAMKLLLEAYYEPTFSDRSHGFRPQRGCHTALMQVATKHQDVSWFIEGDIKNCFDDIDHETLIGIMEEKIEDGRILSLTRKLLKAGYMEERQHHNTYSGTPQGGIISPLLSNIYLDVFDKWVESELLPKYNRRLYPKGRRPNPEYRKHTTLRHKAKIKGDIEAYKEHGRLQQKLSSVLHNDEGYRKLEYVRYADDFLLSFAGPKCEAEAIKREIGTFLKDRLKLEMSKEKTLITHARTNHAKFLGYEIGIFQSEVRKTVNGKVSFRVPKKVVTEAIGKYTRKGKPVHRGELMREDDLEIIWTFQTEFRGLVEYYRMAHNLHALSKVGWVTQGSLLKTLARKYKTTVAQTSKKFRNTVEVNGEKRTVLTATRERVGKRTLTATYGAVSLARNPKPRTLTDSKPRHYSLKRTQLIARLNANNCEMCGAEGKVEIHHVRKLKDVNKPGRTNKPLWVHRMASIRRKTLACCPKCHTAIHSGNHLTEWDNWKGVLESRVP